MSTDLREELDALAHTQTFSADPSAWDRGRRARRRSRVAAGAATLAVVAVVAGAGALAVRPSGVGPAGDSPTLDHLARRRTRLAVRLEGERTRAGHDGGDGNRGHAGGETRTAPRAPPAVPRGGVGGEGLGAGEGVELLAQVGA